MARIRSIKPELLEDEKTALLTHFEWRLFVSMLLLADDYGNLRANPKQIEGTALWGVLNPGDIQAALSTLQEAGLISLYVVRGQAYAHFTGWSKHQKVDKPGKPLCPGPDQGDPAELPTNCNIRETLATPSREVSETLAPDLDLDLDQEKELKDPPKPPKGVFLFQTSPRTRKRPEYSEPFERALAAYPRRDEKADGYAAWKTAAAKEGGEEKLCELVLAALKWQVPLHWAGENWKFAKYFHRYLKKGKWEDQQPQRKSGHVSPKPKPPAPGESVCDWHMYGREFQRDTCSLKCRWFEDGTGVGQAVSHV